MKKIKLTQGKYALVDDGDFEWLSQYNWYYNSNGYARMSRQPKPYMHALLNTPPKGMQTDHIDRNRLNNRRCNLRSVTALENNRNHSMHSTNTSGYTGVSWTKTNKWEVYIWLKNKKIHIGRFSNLQDAVDARLNAEELYYA